ncbi:MAG TPA: hypothetical protein VMW10_02140 [Alphaproteobacteria bacterium]|nr:hypothetical protein [Alphaproteobacteria bacterium]
MKSLLMLLGTLTFVTQAYCKSSVEAHDLVTLDNNSSHSIRIEFLGENHNQIPASILQPGDRKVVNLSELGLDSGLGEGHLSHFAITLEDKLNGSKNNRGRSSFKNSFLVERKPFSGPIKITPAITEYLKLNN